MKRLNLHQYAALLVLIALLYGCSSSDETGSSSNTNAPQANSNSATENAPNKVPDASLGTAPAVQPMPPPITPKADATRNTNAAVNASNAENIRAPKLVVSGKKIDFGKQPQNKTLVKAVVIKNGGRSDLKIESVAAS